MNLIKPLHINPTELFGVVVHHDLSWDTLLQPKGSIPRSETLLTEQRAARNTKPSFISGKRGVETADFVLVQFPDGDGQWNNVMHIAQQHSWEKTFAHDVYAVGCHLQRQSTEVVHKRQNIIATSSSYFRKRATYVFSRRQDGTVFVNLRTLDACVGSLQDWFLFRVPAHA